MTDPDSIDSHESVQSAVEAVDQHGIAACPFCGNHLTYSSGKFNKVGRCDTQGCWLCERKLTVPVDAPDQIAQFNTRASLLAASEGEEIPYTCDACTTGLYNRCECHPAPSDQEKLVEAAQKMADALVKISAALAGRVHSRDAIAALVAGDAAYDAFTRATTRLRTAGEGANHGNV
ncbi:hypothetical protein V474_07530 [Novosphingobium barchaimii LL02]|uniref:Uncharacterized protein n=1 Tax=Novosphingobium barchaimii LL02 TaxID=1114963 RepID=A0A0J7Y9E9_9SPHN|nr:hypothetical protein [Novosphingobium barchaimii]KMS59953.1 hypothetical protein V474_07530 [Novosphingobium barchaimii LL02]